MQVDRRSITTRKATITYTLSPLTKSVLRRVLAVGEASQLFEVAKEADGKPAYVRMGGRIVKPLGVWQAVRRVALKDTDAPQATIDRAKKVIEGETEKLLTPGDCIFILGEVKHGNG